MIVTLMMSMVEEDSDIYKDSNVLVIFISA